MIHLIKKNILGICIILLSVNSYSQNNESKAKAYFNQYLTSKEQFKLIAKSLPTLEQCNAVFKEVYAKRYYEFVSTLDKEIDSAFSKLDFEKHKDCKIESVNTSTLNSEKNSFNGGMDEFQHVFKPNIVFYRVTYVLEDGSESYNSFYKYFVNIDGNWLFFANPGIVFRE
ncbi:hypothetical protein [uncultured Winogradskyella sp.]|uniref:hypothetical protein n=1 Tax=uncultured Winogradskyella sp. TaxID=395353 RepID=UPI002613EE29|nr:hypothetical protein [uncultured Winogradskyella sp.]